MTSGIVMLGTCQGVVSQGRGTNGYAPAFGQAERILSRVTSLGKVTPHLARLLT